MSFSFVFPSVWIFFLTSSCVCLLQLTGFMHIWYWAKNSIKKNIDKNRLHTKENFWHAIFISRVDHVFLKDHTNLQGQMVDFFELFDLWCIFMMKYARVEIIESQWKLKNSALRQMQWECMCKAAIFCFSELWWVITGKLNLKYSRRRPPIAPMVYLAVTRLVPSL